MMRSSQFCLAALAFLAGTTVVPAQAEQDLQDGSEGNVLDRIFSSVNAWFVPSLPAASSPTLVSTKVEIQVY